MISRRHFRDRGKEERTDTLESVGGTRKPAKDQGRQEMAIQQRQGLELQASGKQSDREVVQDIAHSLANMQIASEEYYGTAEEQLKPTTDVKKDKPSGDTKTRVANYGRHRDELRTRFKELIDHMSQEKKDDFQSQYNTFKEEYKDADSKMRQSNAFDRKKIEKRKKEGELDIQSCLNKLEKMVNKMQRTRDSTQMIRQQVDGLNQEERVVIKSILERLDDLSQGYNFDAVKIQFYEIIKTFLDLPQGQREAGLDGLRMAKMMKLDSFGLENPPVKDEALLAREQAREYALSHRVEELPENDA